MTDTTYWTMIDSPLGPLLLTADENGISRVVMDADIDEQIAPSSGWIADPSRFAEARRQLEEYFAGQRTEFDLPLNAKGTAFQHDVWTALQTIPYGEIRSYGHIAAQEHHVLSVWPTVATPSRSSSRAIESSEPPVP